MTFHVIDPRTGREPVYDRNHIGREKWFKESQLRINFIDEWVLTERGSLALCDSIGAVAYPPPGRFKVIFEGDEKDG